VLEAGDRFDLVLRPAKPDENQAKTAVQEEETGDTKTNDIGANTGFRWQTLRKGEDDPTGLIGAFIGELAVPDRRIPQLAIHELPLLALLVVVLLGTAALTVAGIVQAGRTRRASAHL
jgi:hypothetical protein